MNQLDVTTSMDTVETIRAKWLGYEPINRAARLFIPASVAHLIDSAPADIDVLLDENARLAAEAERLTEEVQRLLIRDESRTKAARERQHIDTQPPRKRCVGRLPFVGIVTARGPE